MRFNCTKIQSFELDPVSCSIFFQKFVLASELFIVVYVFSLMKIHVRVPMCGACASNCLHLMGTNHSGGVRRAVLRRWGLLLPSVAPQPPFGGSTKKGRQTARRKCAVHRRRRAVHPFHYCGCLGPPATDAPVGNWALGRGGVADVAVSLRT